MTSCNLHWDPNNVLFTKLAHWDGNFVRTEATASGFNFGILLAGNGCEVSLGCWANSCSNPGWWVTWLICDKLKGTSWGLSGKFLCHRWFAGRSECRNGQWLKYWQWITTLFWLWIRNHKRQSNWYQWRRSTFYFLTKKLKCQSSDSATDGITSQGSDPFHGSSRFSKLIVFTWAFFQVRIINLCSLTYLKSVLYFKDKVNSYLNELIQSAAPQLTLDLNVHGRARPSGEL